jgi:site-specific DNA-cytosine methylase
MGGLVEALKLAGASDEIGKSLMIILFETDPYCRKLLHRHHLRDGIWLSSISSDLESQSGPLEGSSFAIISSFDSLVELLKQFTNLKSVLVAGGSPCVGFSLAKRNRLFANDAESCKIWIFVVFPSLLRQALPELNILFMVENVPLKDSPEALAQRSRISSALGVEFKIFQASKVAPAERERAIWSNITASDLLAVQVDTQAVISPGWRPAWEFPSWQSKPDARFGTFCRGFPAGQPQEVEESHKTFARLPLHSYNERGLVVKHPLSPAELDTVTHWFSRAVRIQVKNLRQAGSAASKARGSLAKWIHSEGGSSLIRPLNSSERDLALGFPSGSSSLSDEPPSAEYKFELDECRSTGNSFSVPVIAHCVSNYVRWIVSGGECPLNQGHFPTTVTREAALNILSAPSGSM